MVDDDEPIDAPHSEREEREAEWRWGNSEAFAESKRRTARYGKNEWDALKAEGVKLRDALAAAKRRGVSSTSPEALALAELNREYNSKWFYETSHAMHARLAEMYVDDPRFRAVYDDAEPGLAEWYRDAILENGKRAGADLSQDSALADLRASMGISDAQAVPFAEDKEARRTREQAAKQELQRGTKKR